MNEKKEFIIKIRNSQAYLKNTTGNEVDYYTFDIKNAKRFTKEDAQTIIESKYEECEIVLFKQELYKIKNERFKIFVNALLLQENTSILPEDIKIFAKELKEDGIYIASSNLNNKYPENKLINEIDRISQKIEFKKNCNGIPSKYKAYKDICEEYDYDDEREVDILLLNFKEKYMNIEILEEYENELEGQ